jgi:dCTP deaminase
MLTGNEIMRQIKKGNIGIEPFDIKCLNPNSYNVHLSNKLKVYNNNAILDLKTQNNDYREIIIPREGLVLLPNTLYIGSTTETVSSDKFISAIDGRSSIGRLGMQVHLTAGFGDIGFRGTYTLEITVVQPVRVYADYPIAQIYFEKPDGKVDYLYNGRYQEQKDPTVSRSSVDTRSIKGYHYSKGEIR